MKCMKETEQEWVFMCAGCEQVNVITKPEYKKFLRDQVRRDRATGMPDGVRKFF
jgi:hypothetical protein